MTRGLNKPFDDNLGNAMWSTTKKLCGDIQGTKCAYVQSDEISILITDFDKLETAAWFDYNIQKMCGISASIASVTFNSLMPNRHNAVFDCRIFNIPKEEACNYFVWRQQDWIRNSVSMLAQSHFSHKQLYKKSCTDMHDMLHEKGVNWATDIKPVWKNGGFIEYNNGWILKPDVIFTQDRNIIERYFIPKEE